MSTVKDYYRAIDWDVLAAIVRTVLGVAGMFFFVAWVGMVLWGIVADEVGTVTLSYLQTLIGLAGLWIAIAPLIWVSLRLHKPPQPDPWA